MTQKDNASEVRTIIKGLSKPAKKEVPIDIIVQVAKAVYKNKD